MIYFFIENYWFFLISLLCCSLYEKAQIPYSPTHIPVLNQSYQQTALIFFGNLTIPTHQKDNENPCCPIPICKNLLYQLSSYLYTGGILTFAHHLSYFSYFYKVSLRIHFWFSRTFLCGRYYFLTLIFFAVQVLSVYSSFMVNTILKRRQI